MNANEDFRKANKKPAGDKSKFDTISQGVQNPFFESDILKKPCAHH